MEILQFIVKKTTVNELFMRHGCKIIDNLCNVPGSVNMMGAITDELIRVFLDNCLEPNRSANSINNCLCTIINLLTNSANAAISLKYIEYVLVCFSNISNMSQEKK
jgi:hypothetical protein